MSKHEFGLVVEIPEDKNLHPLKIVADAGVNAQIIAPALDEQRIIRVEDNGNQTEVEASMQKRGVIVQFSVAELSEIGRKRRRIQDSMTNQGLRLKPAHYREVNGKHTFSKGFLRRRI